MKIMTIKNIKKELGHEDDIGVEMHNFPRFKTYKNDGGHVRDNVSTSSSSFGSDSSSWNGLRKYLVICLHIRFDGL